MTAAEHTETVAEPEKSLVENAQMIEAAIRTEYEIAEPVSNIIGGLSCYLTMISTKYMPMKRGES